MSEYIIEHWSWNLVSNLLKSNTWLSSNLFTESSHKITSLSVNQRRFFSVYGYIRDNEKELELKYDIPDGVKQIIMMYFSFNEFRFDRVSPCYDISEDKLSATLQASKFGTIQFGEFLKSNDNLIYRVKFLMENVSSGHIGFGFITPDFNRWNHGKGYNNCEKHCVCLYSHGYFNASPKFIEINKHYNKQSFITKSGRILHSLNSGDQVVFEVNMAELKAKIMFYEDLKEKAVFQINLLDEVAIIIDGGYLEQTVRVMEQSFDSYTTETTM